VFDGHGFSGPRWSSGSLWHGKRREDVNGVMAKSEVDRLGSMPQLAIGHGFPGPHS
jgi:hypothetical protein